MSYYTVAACKIQNKCFFVIRTDLSLNKIKIGWIKISVSNWNLKYYKTEDITLAHICTVKKWPEYWEVTMMI